MVVEEQAMISSKVATLIHLEMRALTTMRCRETEENQTVTTMTAPELDRQTTPKQEDAMKDAPGATNPCPMVDARWMLDTNSLLGEAIWG